MITNQQPNHLERARELLRLNKLDQAMAEVQRALAADPSSAEPHVVGSWILRRQGRYKDAEQAAQAALAIEPNDQDAHLALALALWSQGRPRDTEQAFRAAHAVNPDRAWLVLTNYARFLVNQMRLTDALDVATEAARQVPHHEGPHASRAMALVPLARYAEAEVAINTVLKLNPRSAIGFELLGDLRLAQGRAEEAADAYREQLRINPHDHDGRIGLIKALKARYRIYRVVLWLSQRTSGARANHITLWYLGILGAAFVAMLIVARVWPPLLPVYTALFVIFGGMVAIMVYMLLLFWLARSLWAWIGEPIFNTILALDPQTRAVIDYNTADAVLIGGLALTVVSSLVAALASAVRGPTASSDIGAGMGMTIIFLFLMCACSAALRHRTRPLRIVMLGAIIIGVVSWALFVFPLLLFGHDGTLLNALGVIGILGWATAMLAVALGCVIGVALKR